MKLKKFPVVTIIGRQNVGKSTLFNSLIKEKKAIVDSFPGLTRDILTYRVNHPQKNFLLADTPGLDLSDKAELSLSILQNTKNYLQNSSLLVLLLENPSLHPFDYDLINLLRKISLPSIIAINKMDYPEDMENLSNFYELGFQDLIPISAKRRINLNLLLDKIISILPSLTPLGNKTEKVDLNLALVGRANSGKSTLLNTFMGQERSIVSNIPGTTRDAVDEYFNFQGKTIRVIDTAGIKKKSRINDKIEYYSFNRTIKAIEKSEVVIHLLDVELGITETDKKIADQIAKAAKPLILAINKWDLISKDTKTFNNYKDRVIFKLYVAEDYPIISISAKNKIRTHKILQEALLLNEKAKRKIMTPELNKIINELQKSGKIPHLGKKLKIYYATQVDESFPKFKFFVNDQKKFTKDIIRFLKKNLQQRLNLHGVPIIFDLEGKKKK